MGLLLVDSGFKGTAKDTLAQLEGDLKGFLSFAVVILILGGLGTIDSIRPVSKGLLLLVFIVFFLKHGNAIVESITSTATSNSPAPLTGVGTMATGKW
jgi:hypothetical protein